MKYKLLLFIILFLIGNFIWAKEETPNLIFSERVFDFGKLLEKDGKITHVFTFKNNQEEPVLIKNVASGCSCVSASYPTTPIKPGKEGQLSITYTPHHPGFFSKEIRIFTNDHKKIYRIWIKGTVISYQHPVEEDYPYDLGSGLHLNLKVFSFGRLKGGEEKTITVKYANDTPHEMKLDFISENKQQTNLLFTKPDVLPPNGRAKLLLTYRMPVSIKDEQYNETLQVIVNGKKLQKTIQVKATGVVIQQ